MNIADWFSLYRIVAFPFLLSLIFLNHPFFFAFMLLISLSTDMIDGFLARGLKLRSERGAQLDSYGDALTFVAGLFGLFWYHWGYLQAYWPFIAAIFGVYLVQLIMAYWRYGKPSSFHTYLAKCAALFQGLFMVSIFFWGPQDWLLYLALVLSFVETLEEIVLIAILPTWKTDVKGLFWVLRGRK